MAEEKKNSAATNKEPEIPAWKDVHFNTSNLSIQGIVDVLNVFNARLVQIEDATVINVNGQSMNLTTYYRLQTEMQAADEKKKAAESEKKANETK